MGLKKFAFVVAALALSAPVLAESHVEPAVKPGGDIPAKFRPAFNQPYPANGDIPAKFNAPRSGFQYVSFLTSSSRWCGTSA